MSRAATLAPSKPPLRPQPPLPAVAPPQPTPEAHTAFFRLATSQTLHVPKAEAIALAMKHQGLPHSPTERERDPKRVKELLERIRSGFLLPCNWATVLYNGIVFRMNGQHSSEALVEGADLLPALVAIHFDHYETDSPEGMGQLFRQFDARFSGRSKQDVAGAYQGLIPALEGVSREKGKLGIEGIGWYNRVVEGLAVRSGDDLYLEFMTEAYHAFLRWLDKILSLKTPELRRAPIVAAMYGTFITSESGSQEFWPHVAKGDINDDSDPRAVLSAELVAIKEAKGKAAPTSPVEFYSKCVKAWGAFRNGDKIRSLNVNPKKGLPEIAA